ncbi:hypothetical protein WH7805_00970 [Synechococcus sp. WH 7805]|nr:hypothetical protein WH7805_00970 [Synechococcus sp. WH 7805]
MVKFLLGKGGMNASCGEADAVAEPAGYRRIRTPRAGLYRYRVLNGDAVDVRFCVF